jgi:hypothetical protein
MDWGNHNFLNNFQRLGLRGFERPLCSCLQTWNNSNFFVSIKKLGYALLIIIDKPKTKVFTMVQPNIWP